MFGEKKRSIRRKKVLTSTLVVIVFIVLCGILFTWNKMRNETGENVNNLFFDEEVTENQIKVACVGDSITYGYGISHWAKNNYPKILNDLLGENYQVGNFGESGICAQATGDQPYMETEVYEQSISYEADILIFMLGTNDSKLENWQNIENFRKHYLELLDSYLPKQNVPQVYLCTPAQVYYTDGKTTGLANFEVQPEVVNQIAECVRQIAEERGYTLIDINALTAEHPEWFEEDGVHPNADGAEAIAKEVWLRMQ